MNFGITKKKRLLYCDLNVTSLNHRNNLMHQKSLYYYYFLLFLFSTLHIQAQHVFCLFGSWLGGLSI
uniref:Uncharacterized protein n=1 Tax=Rhizophora mucronata TaxID=61149 RepID=A0A2P2NGC7_RHIMU